jgi:hypothetical protein
LFERLVAERRRACGATARMPHGSARGKGTPGKRTKKRRPGYRWGCLPGMSVGPGPHRGLVGR